MAEPVLFRVHFADGTAIDVAAPTPAYARNLARERHPGIVTKVKRVKEATHG